MNHTTTYFVFSVVMKSDFGKFKWILRHIQTIVHIPPKSTVIYCFEKANYVVSGLSLSGTGTYLRGNEGRRDLALGILHSPGMAETDLLLPTHLFSPSSTVSILFVVALCQASCLSVAIRLSAC